MRIRFWGARGSIPVSGAQYVKYGGDTACAEVRTGRDSVIVIDAGTGIRRLGKELRKEGKTSCHMLFTHLHWDHVMGFPFFSPIYGKNFKIDFLGCPFANGNLGDLIGRIMQPPHFPVSFGHIAAGFNFQPICGGKTSVDDVAIDSITLSHPNGGMGYRFTQNGKVFVFLTDNELGYRHEAGLDSADYIRFCTNADLLVHDAEFTAAEYPAVRGWGHSTTDMALELALKAGVKKLGLFHHNQDRSDDALDAIVADCRKTAAGRVDVFAVSPDTALEL